MTFKTKDLGMIITPTHADPWGGGKQHPSQQQPPPRASKCSLEVRDFPQSEVKVGCDLLDKSTVAWSCERLSTRHVKQTTEDEERKGPKNLSGLVVPTPKDSQQAKERRGVKRDRVLLMQARGPKF